MMLYGDHNHEEGSAETRPLYSQSPHSVTAVDDEVTEVGGVEVAAEKGVESVDALEVSHDT